MGKLTRGLTWILGTLSLDHHCCLPRSWDGNLMPGRWSQEPEPGIKSRYFKSRCILIVGEVLLPLIVVFAFVLLRTYFIIWKIYNGVGGVGRRERKKQGILHLLVQSPNDGNSQGKAGLKMGNSYVFLTWVQGTKDLGYSLLYSPVHVVGSWIGSAAVGVQSLLQGMPVSGICASLSFLKLFGRLNWLVGGVCDERQKYKVLEFHLDNPAWMVVSQVFGPSFASFPGPLLAGS